VIGSFGDQGTEDLFNGRRTKASLKLQEVSKVLGRKLDMLNAATTLHDLKAPPNNHLEELKDDLKGYHSIRVNRKIRLIFLWKDGGAYEVRCADYH
jgi:toxin HigB-1